LQLLLVDAHIPLALIGRHMASLRIQALLKGPKTADPFDRMGLRLITTVRALVSHSMAAIP
jgi:hypothetical protein